MSKKRWTASDWEERDGGRKTQKSFLRLWQIVFRWLCFYKENLKKQANKLPQPKGKIKNKEAGLFHVYNDYSSDYQELPQELSKFSLLKEDYLFRKPTPCFPLGRLYLPINWLWPWPYDNGCGQMWYTRCPSRNFKYALQIGSGSLEFLSFTMRTACFFNWDPEVRGHKEQNITQGSPGKAALIQPSDNMSQKLSVRDFQPLSFGGYLLLQQKKTNALVHSEISLQLNLIMCNSSRKSKRTLFV